MIEQFSKQVVDNMVSIIVLKQITEKAIRIGAIEFVIRENKHGAEA